MTKRSDWLVRFDMSKSLRDLLIKSKLSVTLVIVTLVVLASVLGSVIFLKWYGQTNDIPSGYQIEDPIVNEFFTSRPTSVIVTPAFEDMLVIYGKGGMSFYGKGPTEHVSVTKDLAADTVVVSFNMKNVFRYDYGSARVTTTFGLGDDNQYSAIVEPGRYCINVTFISIIDGVEEIAHQDFFHDRTDRVDVLFQVKNGVFLVEMNGVESVQTMPILNDFHPRLGEVRFSERTDFPMMSPVIVTNLQIGSGTKVEYHDMLHTTILPDGKDFAFTIHMHADRAYPSMMFEMAELSKEYGLNGSYDAWWKGTSTAQHGMETPEYVAGLHALQDAGWDIGVHAGGYSTMTREQVIAALENITAEFGPIPEWSDHGTAKQDLSQQGTNESSPYYTEDLIKAIGAAWWYNGSHSNSQYYDLNYDGMDYNVKGFEDIPTFRVSEGYGHDLFMDQGRQIDTASFLRAWAYDRSVFVMHDYFAYYFYVQNSTGNYSVFPPHDGIANTPWSQLNPKMVFTNDQWHPLPRFISFLEMTRNYDVWFPTVREVYDRSTIVQQIMVKETDEEVRITNPTSNHLEGFTLFTRSQPSYTLVNQAYTLVAEKGAVDSWAFVMDLQPGVTLVLKKANQGPPRAVFPDFKSMVFDFNGYLLMLRDIHLA